MIHKSTTQPIKARVFQHGDSQAVRLPADFRFDTDEVFVTRNDSTGDVILSTQLNKNTWKSFIEFRDGLDIPREDVENYLAERPMNVVDPRPGIFENDS